MRRWLAALSLLACCSPESSPPPVVTAETTKKGAEVWATRCSLCHGDRGAGDTPFAAAYPGANLTDGHWVHGSSHHEIVRTVRDGVPGTAMSAFGPVLLPEEIEAVAVHVESFKH